MITLESPLDCKEIKSVNLKGNQSWIFLGSTDAEAEAPILWPPNGKNWLLGIHPDAGKDWRQGEKRTKRMRWLDGITKSVDMSLKKLKRQWRTEKLGVLQSTTHCSILPGKCHGQRSLAQRVRHNLDLNNKNSQSRSEIFKYTLACFFKMCYFQL